MVVVTVCERGRCSWGGGGGSGCWWCCCRWWWGSRGSIFSRGPRTTTPRGPPPPGPRCGRGQCCVAAAGRAGLLGNGQRRGDGEAEVALCVAPPARSLRRAPGGRAKAGEGGGREKGGPLQQLPPHMALFWLPGRGKGCRWVPACSPRLLFGMGLFAWKLWLYGFRTSGTEQSPRGLKG